jgi:formylmethanofuran dehydrogenase subunit B
MSIKKFIQASLESEEQGSAPARPGSEAFTDYDAAYHSGVCAGCSCLCDDISCYVKEGRVVRTLNLCEVGWRRLCTISAEGRIPPPSPSRLSEELEQAAELLRSHPPVLVLGADSVDEAAVRAALDLARGRQGVWLPWAFPGLQRFYKRARSFGWATALLDEVRDHSELVVFWRADPLRTHHRHLSRYSFFARGRFTERGNLDRNLTAVASDKTVIEPLCQQFFQLPTGQDVALLEALAHPHKRNGFDHRDLPGLVRALQGASFVSLFVDPENVDDEALDFMFRWSAETNAAGHQRIVILPLWDGGSNSEGFCRVSFEEIGTPWGEDFSTANAGARLEGLRWEDAAETVNSVLVIPAGTNPSHGKRLPEALASKPRVVIDPFKQTSNGSGSVVIPAALPGVESDGIFFRADGLPFETRRMEALTDHGYPAVRSVLAAILEQ